LGKSIDFGPSRTHWKHRFSLGLRFAGVVGEVYHYFTSLVDGVFVGLDSIDVGYGKSTPIGFANLNIFEPVRLLSVWRLSIALLRVFGLRLHTSIRRRV
jgi:hypothetical protein